MFFGFFRKREYRIFLKKEEIEPEEILLDEEGEDYLEKKIERPISSRLFFFFFLGTTFLFLIFLGKTFYLSVIKHNYFKILAEKNIYRTIYKLPERGRIFDRNNKDEMNAIQGQNITNNMVFTSEDALDLILKARDGLDPSKEIKADE